jgi:hypothetical protein
MWLTGGCRCTATIPPRSRRAITTPAEAVTVSRSPPRQPSTLATSSPPTRPDESTRPIPHDTPLTTRGTSADPTGRWASGSGTARRPEPPRPSRIPCASGGITGASRPAAALRGRPEAGRGGQEAAGSCREFKLASVTGKIQPSPRARYPTSSWVQVRLGHQSGGPCSANMITVLARWHIGGTNRPARHRRRPLRAYIREPEHHP